MKKISLIFLASWLYADMNFEDVISKAINYHPSIKVSQEEFKMSEEAINSAMWQYYPTPSVDFSNSKDNDQIVARLEQPIWTGGKLDSQYALATTSKTESQYTLEESKYKLIERILNLLQVYSQANSSQIALKEGYKRLNEFSEMIQRRIESGISSKADEILLDSRLIQIKTDLVNAETRKSLALKQLSLLVGEEIESINFDLNSYKDNENKNVNVLIEEMKLFHPTLKIIDQQIKGSIHLIEKEESVLYPTLSLVGEHKKGDIYDKNNNTSDSSIYLSLKASTGAGLSLFSNVEKAKLNLKKVKSERDTKEQDLLDSFVVDYRNMLLSKEKIEILKSSEIATSNLFESYKRLFLAGKKQWLDLVNSSKDFMDASVSYRETKELYNILRYKIALQTGMISLEGYSMDAKKDIVNKYQK